MTSNLLELAERAERAEEPDRELDALIEVQRRRLAAYAAGLNDSNRAQWQASANGGVHDPHTVYTAPYFTASIDAALSLVPEGAGVRLDRYWIAEREGPVWMASICSGGVPENPRQVFEVWDCVTPALALVAAALRARSTNTNEGE